MGETIKLDSAHRAAVRGIAKDSILTCSKTSAPEVIVNGIISNKEGHFLFAGDSMAAPQTNPTPRGTICRTSGARWLPAGPDRSGVTAGAARRPGARPQ